MKRLMSALLALALCASAGLAEEAASAVSDSPEEGTVESVRAELPEDAPRAMEPTPSEALSPEELAGSPADAEAEALGPEIPPEEGIGAPGGAIEGGEWDGAEVSPEQIPEGGAAIPEEIATADGIELPGPDAQSDPEGEAAGEGYVVDGVVKRPGTLAELLAEPGEKTVYVTARQPVTIPDFPLALLKGVTFLPGPETFPGEAFAVKLLNGEMEITPEQIDAAEEGETVALTVAVVELPPDPERIEIKVEPVNYEPDTWMNWYPEFRLSGIPADAQGCSYVAVIYGERFVPLSEDFYIPTEEGVYALRFAILDAQGDVVSGSETYSLMLDLTPPALTVEVSQKRDYTLRLSATDAPGGSAELASGVAEFSLDGGERWQPLGEDELVKHSEARKKTFPPQTILVRDLAGNASGNEEEIVLDKLIDDSSLGGWGGGGGASSTPKPPHASGSGDDSPYAAYELSLPKGAVEALKLGGEEIDLGLRVDGAGPEPFSAKLTTWARENPAEEKPAKDTLVIRAESNVAEGAHAYAWRINGSVLRKLYNSDIAYLALCADGAMLSLPTVGFTAGTKYAELKMGGVSTAEFEYEIAMTIDPDAAAKRGTGAWNLSPNCDVALSVTVAGERYDMIDRAITPEMYPYDVYCGPEDLPDYPYGAYPGAETEG